MARTYSASAYSISIQVWGIAAFIFFGFCQNLLLNKRNRLHTFFLYLSVIKESDDIIQFVMLTLHAAIATVLEIHRVPLCAKELADEINRRRLYIRRDRTLLRSSQIHARVKNYPALFEKSGGVITLKK